MNAALRVEILNVELWAGEKSPALLFGEPMPSIVRVPQSSKPGIDPRELYIATMWRWRTGNWEV